MKEISLGTYRFACIVCAVLGAVIGWFLCVVISA